MLPPVAERPVEGGGVLYAVIIALWIAILLPMWLRRHDEALESRSVDRFTSAMRTLSARSAGDRREVVMPARSADPLHADGPRGTARAVADGRAVLAARRRRTLGLLAATTLVVAGLALLAVVPTWALAVPVVLLAGFLVHLRRQTRVQAALDRRRHAQAVTAERRRIRAAARPHHRPVDVEVVLPAERPVAVPATAHGAVASDVEAEEAPYDSEADHAWEPVPVPLPTYVTAPKAPRSVRVIDLTKPGLWTSGRLSPEEAEQVVAEALAAESAEWDEAAAGSAVRHERADGDGIVTGEVVIERRRAVNG